MDRYTKRIILAKLVCSTNQQDLNTAQFAKCAYQSMITTASGKKWLI